MKEFFIGFGIVLVLIVLFLGLDYGYLHWFKFIEPQKEDARHKVFKATRSYNEGKVQDLIKMRLEYLQAKDEESKSAIAFSIRHMFAEYNETQLSSELKYFLKKIKYGE